jgi:hypothetical protein
MKLPDILILIAAALALFMSVGLWYMGQVDSALFVGLWVPSILGFGVFVRQALQMNRDNSERRQRRG